MPPAVLFAREPARAQRGRPAGSRVALSLFNEAQQIAAEFLRVEAHAQILHTQDTALINDRSEKGMIHVTVWTLCREHAIAARHVANGCGRSGEEGPAVRIGAERLRILLQYLRGIALGIDGDGDKGDLLAEVSAEPILHERHHRRED